MKALVCWNACHESEKQKLENIFLSILKNEGNTLELDFVFSESEFKQKKDSVWEYNSIIVLCELTWNNKPYSRLCGIDLVQKEIRLKRINLPVLFLSFLSLRQILEIDNSKQIIRYYALGHHFIQLPIDNQNSIEMFYKMKPLERIEMVDTLNFCSLDRMISTIQHDVNEHNKENLVQTLILILNSIDVKDKEKYIQEIKQLNDVDDIKNFCTKIEPLLRVQAGDNSLDDLPQYKCKVLILEDESDLSEFIKEAKSRSVEIAHYKRTSEAISAIQKDINNDFSVLIIDYRIKDNPSDDYSVVSEKQGYLLCNEALEMGRVYEYMIFSDLSKDFKTDVANEMRVSVNHTKKENIKSPDGRKKLIDEIINLAKKNRVNVSSQGSSKKEFIQLYNILRKGKFNKSFDDYEKIISDKSKEYIEKFNRKCTKESYKEKDNPFVVFWHDILRSSQLQADIKVKSIPLAKYQNIAQEVIALVNKAKEQLQVDDIDTKIRTVRRSLREEILSINEKHNIKITDNQVNQIVSIYFENEQSGNNDDLLKQILEVLIGEQDLFPFSSQNTDNINTDYISQKTIDLFIDRLIIRRFSIYLYFWFEINANEFVKEFGLVKTVDWFLSRGYVDPIAAKNALSGQRCWITAKPNKRIRSFNDVSLTREEEKFFESNYPDLYSKWKE